jgi:hypothetical protein
LEVRKPHIQQNPIHTPLDANTCDVSYTTLEISYTGFILSVEMMLEGTNASSEFTFVQVSPHSAHCPGPGGIAF